MKLPIAGFKVWRPPLAASFAVTSSNPQRLLSLFPISFTFRNSLFNNYNSLGLLKKKSFCSCSFSTLTVTTIDKHHNNSNVKEVRNRHRNYNVFSKQDKSSTINEKLTNLLGSFFETPMVEKSKDDKQELLEDWKTIYKFQYIKHARAVQRLKLYQTVFTCAVATPLSLLLSVTGNLEGELCAFILSTSVLACAMLYVMGNFCAKVIGIMYVTDKDPEIIRVAHLTFWGTRKDEVFMKTDFIPLSELPDDVSDVYVSLKLYSEPNLELYLSLKYGTVLDEKAFTDIFGDFDLSKPK